MKSVLTAAPSQTNAAARAAFCFALLFAAGAHAQAPAAVPALYASIADMPAIVYDAPSAKAVKTFIFARLQPVEVLVRLDKWAKIRDAENTIGWVEAGALGNTRSVQIIANLAEVRDAPNENGSIVFVAQRSVLLESTGLTTPDGWLPVRHRDGQTGFVARAQIWGD